MDAGVERARDILRKKRADDALPLLPALARHGPPVLALAERCLAGAPRPPARVAVADAFRVAAAAALEPAFRCDAQGDAALLRARFVADGAVVRPRVGPFIERVAAAGGATRWVIKGVGENAQVRVIERRGERPGGDR
jgi:hypothetical protein